MLPRKRQRPNPGPPTTALSREVATPQTVSSPALGPPQSVSSALGPPPLLLRSHRSIAALSAGKVEKQLRKSTSWYGVWPSKASKATASTSIARENILAATLRSARPPDLARFDMSPSTPSQQRESGSAPDEGESSSKTQPTERDAPTADKNDDVVPVNESTAQPDPAPRPLRSATSYSWLGWWSGSAVDEEDRKQRDESSTCVVPNPSEQQTAEQCLQTVEDSTTTTTTTANPSATEPMSSLSWFGLWPAYYPVDSTTCPPTHRVDDATVTEITPPPSPPNNNNNKKSDAVVPKAGSTWAFWSTNREAGEVAVMGEASENHPQPTTAMMVPEKSTWRRRQSTKRARPPSPAPSDTPAEASTTTTTLTTTPTANMVLPCFSTTYSIKEKPSFLQQVAEWVLPRSSPHPPPHVTRSPEPRRIRKAVAIGVHGLIPAAYLRPMIGQPTGTSLRLASLCGESLRRWADSHGCPDCQVQTIALEGEGRIGDRVDNLWRLLLNWMDALRRADCVLIAAHSQGVPVAVMLLQRLVDFGILDSQARIGICAMAGVTVGPFSDFRSGLLPSSATELWDLADGKSVISLKFQASLARILDAGARVSLVASLDDQLVPLDSALYAPAHHPYIHRSVFVDGRLLQGESPAPDFIALLVSLALKLRNLGLDDNGLLRELARPLAGSLYSGEGHSRLYYDAAVYDVAVSHLMETDAIPLPGPLRLEGYDAVADATGQNFYLLPWIMRGVLDAAAAHRQLRDDALELLGRFDGWRPGTKALRDVKYRLEAVRSKM
ncbi:hypothetical protein CP533_5244 [Ophiocordyceps camponoti-saundersi (nom. inval.)]|nr:hypothetical protein CP533_5244 [Ophiocordyceps camponoti-saundersi (nom. inval.)]